MIKSYEKRQEMIKQEAESFHSHITHNMINNFFIKENIPVKFRASIYYILLDLNSTYDEISETWRITSVTKEQVEENYFKFIEEGESHKNSFKKLIDTNKIIFEKHSEIA